MEKPEKGDKKKQVKGIGQEDRKVEPKQKMR
jgi:hypothetical protein